MRLCVYVICTVHEARLGPRYRSFSLRTARVAYNAAFRVRVISRHLEHCLMRLCVYVIRTVEKERFRARFGSLFARKHPVTR